MPPIHLAIALDGAGRHPAAWRHASARPAQIMTAAYWTDLARTAEEGLIDFVTIEDAFGLQSTTRNDVDHRTDQVRGRLEAVLIASLLGPLTNHIGLVPAANTTHSEPFHLASATSTLDWVSKGRGGWLPQIATQTNHARHVGLRRPAPDIDQIHRAVTPDDFDPDTVRGYLDLFDEAADVVETVRRLWDSWEDDAIIRDVPTGRFIDRDKLHYIDFSGRFFSVKGPSIVPRPPQGQPLIVAPAHDRASIDWAAQAADVVLVPPQSDDDVADWVGRVRTAEQTLNRHESPADPVRIFADLVVFLDTSRGTAIDRLEQLDEWNGATYGADARTFVGTPDELAELLVAWQAGGVEGFRLHPGVIGHDLDRIVTGVVPALQRRGVFRTAYRESTLRARLGLGRPANRYAQPGFVKELR